MYVTSKAGTEILKSQYEIIDSINGIPTLETDYSQLKHNHTEPMMMLSPAFNDKYIMVLKEQESVTESSRLRLTGVHSFIYDFSLDRIYEEYTQYFSLENILTLVFSDTEYEYEVSGSTRYNALEFENFGNNDKMSLINQICDRWELEYRVKGNKVYFADQRGSKTTKQFRYKMNIHDSHVNLDISEGATYIRAYFGKKDEENPSNSTYVEKEMLHPLAEDFGVRHAKPYSNEVITQEETMQRYMKMKIEETWKLSVEIDVLDLSGDGSAEVGDEVWAIDERMDLKYKTRIIEKRDYYDVNDRIYRTKVVLGNKTFIEAVSAQEVTADDVESQVVKYYNQMIEQLKADFDNDFNAERDAYKAMLEQAKADIFTEIAADKDRMENILETMTVQWTEDFNQSVAESKEYAEQQAQAKAEEVRTDLETVTSEHQTMLEELELNVIDIDDFLGDNRSVTLDERFLEANLEMEERIRNINVNSYNMLQGTRFDESQKFSNMGGTTLYTNQSINRLRITNNDTTNTSSFMFSDPVKIEPNVNHWLVVEYFSFSTTELDYLQLQLEDGSYQTLRNADTGEEGFMSLQSDGNWRKTVIRINSPITLEGKLRMGSRWNRGTAGVWIDVRQPYLTNTTNREWLPHPNDATQSIEQVTRRIYELEDGMSDFITKTQYDVKNGAIDQYIKSVEETAEGNQLVLQRVEDWQATNGQSVLETVDAYERKLWLNDFSEIGANMIPQSVSAFTDGRYWSTGTHANYSSDIRLLREQAIVVGADVRLTFSDRSESESNIDYWLINMVDYTNQTTFGEQLRVNRGGTLTFTTESTRILISAVAIDGTVISQNSIEEPYKRIFVKLEIGEKATPMLNAISHIEQFANKISMRVQELDGDFLSQSDITVRPEYAQIASLRIDGDTIGSFLRVSPTGIDAVAEAMRVSGDLFVKGDITALAIDAIEGNFARLFANQLTANVITSDHIQMSTALVNELFATSARIDELITKRHFVNNVYAMSIEAVEGQFSSLMTKYFSANYIDVNYINGKNAWFESQYTLNANIAKLTSQIAFIRDIQTIEVTANQLNINTLHNKLRGVEGGLTIYGYDGRVLINNSILENTFAINFIQPHFMGVGVTTSGNYFKTTNTNYTTAAAFSYLRGGRYLTIEGYCEMRSDVSGSSDTTVGAIRLMEYSSGSRSAFATIENRRTNKGDNQFFKIRLDLGVPQYEQRNFYVQFYTAHSGNAAHFRINQAYYHG